jgi:pyrrolidone-carboxylate peptidase
MLYVKGNIKGKAEVITFFLLQQNKEGNMEIIRSIQVDPSKESKDALFTGLNKGSYHVVLVAGLGPGIKEITPEQYLKSKLSGEILALKSDVCYKSYPVKKESI